MAKFRPILRQWTGLNTKGLEDGRRGAESVNLQNARLRQGAIMRRPGMVRLDVAGNDAKAMDFVAASSQFVSVAIDTRVWTLGTQFTIRAIVEPDIITGTRPVFRAGASTPSIEITTAGSKVVASIWDSGATKTSVTSTDDFPTTPCSIFFTRDGATLSLKIDNGTADTATMADGTLLCRTPAGALEIARDGTNYYDGTIDSLDAFDAVLPTNADRLLRWPDPMLDPSCICSMDFNATTDDIVKDLSRFRNHGYAQASPTEVTALAFNPAPVWDITPFRGRDRQRVLIHAGALAYIGEVV